MTINHEREELIVKESRLSSFGFTVLLIGFLFLNYKYQLIQNDYFDIAVNTVIILFGLKSISSTIKPSIVFRIDKSGIWTRKKGLIALNEISSYYSTPIDSRGLSLVFRTYTYNNIYVDLFGTNYGGLLQSHGEMRLST